MDGIFDVLLLSIPYETIEVINLFFEQINRYYIEDNSRKYKLMYTAVEENRLDVIKLLISKGVEIPKDILLVARQNLEIAKFLISEGAELDLDDGRFLLEQILNTSRYNSINSNIIMLYIDYVNVTKADYLELCIEINSSIEVIKLLIKKIQPNDDKYLKLIIENYIPTNSQGKIEILTLLLNYCKLDINAENCLFDTIKNNEIDILEFLLDQGADPNILSEYNETCLDVAIDDDYGAVNLDILKLLLNKGAVPSGNLLFILCNIRPGIKINESAVECLLKHGANPNSKENKDALLYAVRKEEINIVNLLIDYGANSRVKVTPVFIMRSGDNDSSLDFTVESALECSKRLNFHEITAIFNNIYWKPQPATTDLVNFRTSKPRVFATCCVVMLISERLYNFSINEVLPNELWIHILTFIQKSEMRTLVNRTGMNSFNHSESSNKTLNLSFLEGGAVKKKKKLPIQILNLMKKIIDMSEEKLSKNINNLIGCNICEIDSLYYLLCNTNIKNVKKTERYKIMKNKIILTDNFLVRKKSSVKSGTKSITKSVKSVKSVKSIKSIKSTKHAKSTRKR